MDVQIDRVHGETNADGRDSARAGGRRQPPHGTPQGLDRGGGHLLLRCVVERLAPAFSEVVVAFGEPEQMEQLVPYRVVFDSKRNAGPLAGLEAGFIAARHDVLFAVDCDMPDVTPTTAQLAVAAARNSDAAIAPHDGP